MIELHEQYLVDEEGNRKAVVVPFSEWEHVLELLEEIRDIRAYDEAKRKPSDPVPFEKAVSEIDEGNPADNKLFDKDRGEDLAPTGRGNQRSEVGGRRSAIRSAVRGQARSGRQMTGGQPNQNQRSEVSSKQDPVDPVILSKNKKGLAKTACPLITCLVGLEGFEPSAN